MPRGMLRRPVLAPLLAGLLVCSFAALSACAHRATSESGSGRASASEMAPPPHSKLAKVREGMSDDDVRLILGAPTTARTYPTGKAWIPFYYGTDTMHTEWRYRGIGRITFSRNQYTGHLKVIRIQYDPHEPGS